jgi:hypothetical protein
MNLAFLVLVLVCISIWFVVWVLWVSSYGKEERWIGIGNGIMEWRFLNKR